MMAERELGRFQASTARWLIGSFAGLLTILLSFIGVGLLIILAKWVQNVSTRYVLTDERLIIKTGIIFKAIDEIELYRVKDVKVQFSLLNQLAGIGTIKIISTDHTSRGKPLIIKQVFGAIAKREMLRTLVDRARRTRGVREMDVGFDRS